MSGVTWSQVGSHVQCVPVRGGGTAQAGRAWGGVSVPGTQAGRACPRPQRHSLLPRLRRPSRAARCLGKEGRPASKSTGQAEAATVRGSSEPRHSTQARATCQGRPPSISNQPTGRGAHREEMTKPGGPGKATQKRCPGRRRCPGVGGRRALLMALMERARRRSRRRPAMLNCRRGREIPGPCSAAQRLPRGGNGLWPRQRWRRT